MRDKVYHLYIAYIFFVLAYFIARTGRISTIGFPELKFTTIPLVTMAHILGCLFIKSFLNTRRHCPKLNRVICVLIICSFIVLPALAGGLPRQANILIHIIGLVSPIVALATGFVRLNQGYAPARVFLVAWLATLIGTVSIGAIGLGLIPSNFITIHAVFVGCAIESILLSIALAERIRALRLEKELLKKQQQHLKVLSNTDSLTGLYNRRWFSNTLNEEIKNARASSAPLSLMFLDIDHFKRFNDTYGHSTGDRVLAELGNVMRTSIRERDFAYRYGGEEFCIILPLAGLRQAMDIAERGKNLSTPPFRRISMKAPTPPSASVLLN